MSAMGQALGDFLPPPPPSSGPPSLWGDADALRNILQETDLQIEGTVSGQVTLAFTDATAGASFLIDTAGHVLSERDTLMGLGRWEDLQTALAELVTERAEANDHGIEVTLSYLMATLSKPPPS